MFAYFKKYLLGLPWWHSGSDSKLSMQGAWVQSLVRELDPTCMPQLRVRMPQLKSPRAATKTQCNQITKYKKKSTCSSKSPRPMSLQENERFLILELTPPPAIYTSMLTLGFFFKLIYFIYLFLAALGPCCCARAFSTCGEQGLLFVVVCGLLIAVSSLVAEHGL